MPATRTGTPSQVNASAGNGSTTITVPADAKAAIALWSHWDGNAGSTLSALTLNGVSFTIQSQLAEGHISDHSGCGVATLINPATGAQTLSWTWSAGGARSEGGWIVVVYVKDCDTSNLVRSSGLNTNTGTGDVSVSITTQSSDLVLAFCQKYNQGGNPALDGTVFIDNALVNAHLYDVSQVTAGASSTTVAMTGEYYSAIGAVAIRQATARPTFQAFALG